MAANTAAIFSRIPDIQWGTIAGGSTANTAVDGTGTVVTIFTSDATNGGRVEKVRIRPLGTNVATVMRFFINNGSTNATAGNNTLLTEITIGITTISQVAALAISEIPNSTDGSFPIALPPGYKINITVGTSVAAGFAVTAIGGKY